MTAEILGMDLDGVCRSAWERHGRLPGELFGSLTPSQFVALFTRPAGNNQLDRVAELQRHNDRRGERGLHPVIPSWL